jgi:hypothetical protein
MMLFEDGRPIKAIMCPASNYEFIAVGENGVTEIKGYPENGEMAPVAWFEIWKGDIVSSRINGKYVQEITY